MNPHVTAFRWVLGRASLHCSAYGSVRVCARRVSTQSHLKKTTNISVESARFPPPLSVNQSFVTRVCEPTCRAVTLCLRACLLRERALSYLCGLSCCMRVRSMYIIYRGGCGGCARDVWGAGWGQMANAVEEPMMEHRFAEMCSYRSARDAASLD